MIKCELKKTMISIYFIISVFLLYMMFMLGDSGRVLPGNVTASVIGGIWNKLHKNWVISSDSSYLVRMYHMWSDNVYLPLLMPFITGLPAVMQYLEEIHSGNKRFLIHRCSRKEYYLSKIIANSVCAVSIAVMAIGLYYLTLLVFYDKIPISDPEFLFVNFAITGNYVEESNEISKYLLICELLKNILYFCVYAVMSSSFCYFFAVWFRDKYVAFGGTIVFCYVLHRIHEGLDMLFFHKGVELAGNIADFLDPIYLYYAGRSGFYEKREWLAVTLAFLILIFNFYMAVRLSKKTLDVCER